jgi:hypothetical protein
MILKYNIWVVPSKVYIKKYLKYSSAHEEI